MDDALRRYLKEERSRIQKRVRLLDERRERARKEKPVATQVDELRREIHKRGFDTQKGGDGHYRVIGPDGEQVRTARGKPIRFPSTPPKGRRQNRWLENTVASLRRVGVLPTPAEVHRGNGGESNEVRLKREQLKQYSDALRIEVVKLLEGGLRQSDLYHLADRLAAEDKMPVPSHSGGITSKFLKGGYLTNDNYAWLSRAVSSIQANNGAVPEPEQPAEEERPVAEPAAVAPPPETVLEAPERPFAPTLAFDAMQLMYATEPDPEAIRDVCDRIANLELGLA